MSSLIIVESPTKSRTISKFLGNEYLVLSSFGHVRDLPKSTLGVDVEHGFKPKYTIPAKAKPVIKGLKEAASKSNTVILATDEDREGEAIAWHLTQVLGLGISNFQFPRPRLGSAEGGPISNKITGSKSKIKNLEPETWNLKPVQRIVFHEITKPAIMRALENPRELDMNLVDAQQARRVLDRLVGYELSPFLWKKIKPGLSAGRVQSVALRLVVEREREIQSFVKQEYWSIEAHLGSTGESEDTENPKTFKAKLIKIGEKELAKFDIPDKSSAEKIIQSLQGAQFSVSGVSRKEVIRNPAPPFTTSTLQQEASRKLGWSAKQTMMIAQRLYETGYITYMRTDSVSLADSAISQTAGVIEKNFGREYVQTRKYATKTKGAQEAHEAVRPTDLSQKPDELGGGFDRGQARLYELIWKRTLASQMRPAVFDQTAVDVLATNYKLQTTNYLFRASGRVMKFDGFIRVYTEGRDEDPPAGGDEDKEGQLPELSVEEKLQLLELLSLQHFTEPPPRYTDATLVKALEIHGIGRPSTYAPTLATIQDRGYVEKVERKFMPTEIGFLVNDMLVENFPEIVDINFTSHVEEELDEIAEGKRQWVPVVEEFYTPFKKNLEERVKSVERHTETSDVPCPHCGKMMVIKFGRTGKYLSCPEPGSKIYQPMPEEAAQIKELEEKTKDERCSICGKEMKVKRGRFGYFLSCIYYPNCRGIAKILNKTGFKCPNCLAGDIVERKSRGRGRLFYACSRFPECKFLTGTKPATEQELKEAFEKWGSAPEKPESEKKGLKKVEK